MAVIPWALIRIPCAPVSGDGLGMARGWRSPGPGDGSPESGPLPWAGDGQRMPVRCPGDGQGMLQVRTAQVRCVYDMYTCAQAQLDVQGATLMLEQVDETESKTFKLCSGPGCQYAAAAAGRTVVDVPQGGDTCRTPVRDANQPSARSKLQDRMTVEHKQRMFRAVFNP